MRIAPQLGVFPFNHDRGVIKPMKDLFDVFHGEIVISKVSLGADNYAFKSKDGLVTGESTPSDGAGFLPTMSTTIRVPSIYTPKQASRWTMVEIYNHLYHLQYEKDSAFNGFQGPRELRLIAPDQRGFQVWNNSAHPDFHVKPVLHDQNLEDDTEYSMFSARGVTLLAAAQTMVKHYAEVMSTPDLDPSLTMLDASMTIGQALGATGMEHFTEVWNEALAQPDPRHGVYYAYRYLGIE